MDVKVYYEDDADLNNLKGKTVAILGYGSQGHAHAQNLRDSGCHVIVGQRAGSANFDLAKRHGFAPLSAAEATAQADIVNLLLPDEVQAEVYQADVLPNLQPGNVLMCSHGFNIHFGYITPPDNVDALLVAPKGPGHLVRSEYERGAGVPCLVAVNDSASDATFQMGLAYAKGIGGTRGGVHVRNHPRQPARRLHRLEVGAGDGLRRAILGRGADRKRPGGQRDVGPVAHGSDDGRRVRHD